MLRPFESDLAPDLFQRLSSEGLRNRLVSLDGTADTTHANPQYSILPTPPFRRLLEFEKKSTFLFQKDGNPNDLNR